MDLPRTTAVAARVRWLDHVGSTNSALVGLATGVPVASDDPVPGGPRDEHGATAEQSLPEEWPHGSVLVTDDQSAGRGRLGRVWQAPPGRSLAISVLLRPALPRRSWGWLPLLAGVAMADVVSAAGARAVVKWPNDVLIGDRKVCGVLAEALPDGSGVVVGAGLNHALTGEQLPVPTATSLAVEGVSAAVDDLVAGFVGALLQLVGELEAAGGDAERGIRARVEAICGTLGRRVRVTLPDGTAIIGTAVGLAADGRLHIARDDAEPLSVSAGDVEHLRYE